MTHQNIIDIVLVIFVIWVSAQQFIILRLMKQRDDYKASLYSAKINLAELTFAEMQSRAHEIQNY